MTQATSNPKDGDSARSLIRPLTSLELDAVVGAWVSYYEMGGHWYIVGHDGNGRATGAVRVS